VSGERTDTTAARLHANTCQMGVVGCPAMASIAGQRALANSLMLRSIMFPER
jgi:hypothetical protein